HHSHTSILLLPRAPPHPYLHSFPTRRSSDLQLQVYGRAAEAFERCARLDDRVARVTAKLALARYRDGDLGGAVASVNETLRLDEDRKSTRLNSSHVSISYAVFCLKKKTNKHRLPTPRFSSALHHVLRPLHFTSSLLPDSHSYPSSATLFATSSRYGYCSLPDSSAV